MMRIGILSDTHSYMDDRILHHLEPCHQIWHAGDIGNIAVADTLEAFRPLKAVFGNIDNHVVRLSFREDEIFTCEGVTVYMTHIAGTPPKYNNRVKDCIAAHQPDILVCGHSHLLLVTRQPLFHNLLHINPGAAGKSGFHKVRTLIRLSIDGKRIYDVEVVELGAR